MNYFLSSAQRLLTIVVLMISLWVCSESAAIADTKEPPKTCRVGVYVVGLRDLDAVKKSFVSDFWIWAVCPTKDINPLESLEIVDAREVKSAYDSVLERQDSFGQFRELDQVFWFQKKVSAQIQYNWNIRNYPFDRHTLKIQIEEAIDDTSAFVYTPDVRNSSYKKNLQIEGWRIKKFKIQGKQSIHHTTFGDPELDQGRSSYSRLIIAIEIQRNTIVSFFKLHAAVYIGIILALASYFLDPSQTSLMGGKISAPVGSLFAVVVNQRAAESVLGRSEELTLTDQIHITAMVYILITIIIAVYSRLISERGEEKQAVRLNHMSAYIASISFFVINSILIIHAAIAG
jgi:hypothetical protein